MPVIGQATVNPQTVGVVAAVQNTAALPDCGPCGPQSTTAVTLPAKSCLDLGVKRRPQAAAFDGYASPSRRQTLTVPGGQRTIIRWTMTDDDGAPINLAHCACPDELPGDGISSSISSAALLCPYTVKFRIRDAVVQSCDYTTAGEVVTAATGEVAAIIPAETATPGIYDASFALLDDSQAVYHATQFRLIISPSVWSTDSRFLDFNSVRTFLRDTDAGWNRVLGSLRFDDADIADAAIECVRYWNETPPQFQQYSVANFPYTHYWTIGAAGRLLLSLAEHHRANDTQTSAAGVELRDHAQHATYEQIGQMRWKEWQYFCDREKAKLKYNSNFAIFTPHSTYNRYW